MLEQEMIKLLDNYAGKLCLANLENCETILQRYKNKLYIGHLSCKLRLNLDNTGDYDENDIKVVSHESFTSQNDTIEKIEMEFKDTRLNVRYEIATEKHGAREGIKINVFHELYLDNYLILRREKDGKKKDLINTVQTMECIKKLSLKLPLYGFLKTILNLFVDARLLVDLIGPLQNEGGISFFTKSWDSDSDGSIELSDDEYS